MLNTGTHSPGECICLSHRNKKRNPRNQQGALSSSGTEKLQLEVLRGPSSCGSKDISVAHLVLGGFPAGAGCRLEGKLWVTPMMCLEGGRGCLSRASPGPDAVSTARRRRKRGERGDWPPLQAGCSCHPQSVLTAPRIHCCKKSGLRPGTRTTADICPAGLTVPPAALQFGWALYCCEGERQRRSV